MNYALIVNLLKYVLKILWINDDATKDRKIGCKNLVQQVSLLLPSCLVVSSVLVLLHKVQIAAITYLSLSTLGRIKEFQGVLVGKATKILTIG